MIEKKPSKIISKPFGFALVSLALLIFLFRCETKPPLVPERICPDQASYFHLRDGWLYYENSLDEKCLYRILPDGSNRQKLSDIPHTRLLGFDGQATYFGVFGYEHGAQNHDWTIDELHRISADGAPAELLFKVAIPSPNSGFIAAGESLFFNDAADLDKPFSKRLHLPSKQIHTISSTYTQTACRGEQGTIFLSREGVDGGIERWESGATEPICILTEPVSEFTVSENWVYFVSTRDLAKTPKTEIGRLYKIPASGGIPVRLDDDGSVGLKVSGNWVYYSRLGALYRSRIDGSKTESIYPRQVWNPLISGDWVYFTLGSPYEAFSSELCRVQTDGSRYEILLKARALFVAAGPDWACYSEEGLYRITLTLTP